MRCAHCLSEVFDRLGYETPAGDALCGPCYFSLWGPRGGAMLMAVTEPRRPVARRPESRRPLA